jgi:hypothetical protein
LVGELIVKKSCGGDPQDQEKISDR